MFINNKIIQIKKLRKFLDKDCIINKTNIDREN